MRPGVVPTKYGDIAVNWSANEDVFRMHVDTPRGTDGTIAVPVSGDAVLTVNGHTVCDHGRCEGYGAHAEDGYVVLTVPGGSYDITVNSD